MEIETLSKFFAEGDLDFGEDYRLQLVPVFSPGSTTVMYKYDYDPEWEWEVVGKHDLHRCSNGSFVAVLWHRVGKKQLDS